MALLQHCIGSKSQLPDVFIEDKANSYNCETIILGGDINTQFLVKFITLLRPFIPSISQFGDRHVVRLIKTPDVENITLKGIATLPLHTALNNENMQTIILLGDDINYL